jgi:pseudoazurin
MSFAVTPFHSSIHRLRPVLGALLLLAAAASANAADHTVKMLTAGKDGSMVFEPAFVKVAVGDTVVFTPTEKAAHNSASLLVPAGAKTWKGGPDQELKVTIDKEGIYLYACQPHKMMGMVGVIQAGKPDNLAAAKAAAAKEAAGFAMGKDRFDKALALVK